VKKSSSRPSAHLQQALGFWTQLSALTRSLYRDMKLTHYNGNSFDANPDNLFHWERILPEVERDVAVAVAATPVVTAK
jgi:hypothetical protein